MLDPKELSDQELIDSYLRFLPTVFGNVADLDPTFRYEVKRALDLGDEVSARGYEIEFRDDGPPHWKSTDPNRPDIIESRSPRASDE